MNRTIPKKVTIKDTLFQLSNEREAAKDFFPKANRWEKKLASALKADFMKPRDVAVTRILELARSGTANNTTLPEF
jgi:uncharacterized protein with NRDE domain